MTQLLAGGLVFAGAVIGAVLAFLGSRASRQQDDRARRREEWGRRFTAALQSIESPSRDAYAVGVAVIDKLLESDLATSEDRELARAALRAAAGAGTDRSLPASAANDVEVVAEWERRSEGTS